MVLDALISKGDIETSPTSNEFPLETLIPVDPHYIHEMNEKTSDHILKLQIFKRMFMPGLDPKKVLQIFKEHFKEIWDQIQDLIYTQLRILRYSQ